MGLDVVELIMEVEEEFDITIEDRDAEKIGTVGLLYHYVLRRLGVGLPVCPSASRFYRLRRTLLDLGQIDRRAIRPSARLDDLLPPDGRGDAWAEVRRALDQAVPGLRYPSWAYGADFGSLPAIALVLILTWGTLGRFDAELGIAFLGVWLLLWLGVVIVIHRAAAPFATAIPWGCETIGGLIRASLPWGDGQVDNGSGARRQASEVWERLRSIIADQVGVSRNEVTEDKHFLHDFGMA
jgi:acyl carrier protein